MTLTNKGKLFRESNNAKLVITTSMVSVAKAISLAPDASLIPQEIEDIYVKDNNLSFLVNSVMSELYNFKFKSTNNLNDIYYDIVNYCRSTTIYDFVLEFNELDYCVRENKSKLTAVVSVVVSIVSRMYSDKPIIGFDPSEKEVMFGDYIHHVDLSSVMFDLNVKRGLLEEEPLITNNLRLINLELSSSEENKEFMKKVNNIEDRFLYQSFNTVTNLFPISTAQSLRRVLSKQDYFLPININSQISDPTIITRDITGLPLEYLFNYYYLTSLLEKYDSDLLSRRSRLVRKGISLTLPKDSSHNIRYLYLKETRVKKGNMSFDNLQITFICRNGKNGSVVLNLENQLGSELHALTNESTIAVLLAITYLHGGALKTNNNITVRELVGIIGPRFDFEAEEDFLLSNLNYSIFNALIREGLSAQDYMIDGYKSIRHKPESSCTHKVIPIEQVSNNQVVYTSEPEMYKISIPQGHVLVRIN